MSKTTRKTIIQNIVKNTGVKRAKASQALECVLSSIKDALARGQTVNLDKLGVLKVKIRRQTRRINTNLKHRPSAIENVHKRHPKTITLVRRPDLSENPLPTVVHKAVVSKHSAAVAFTGWRRTFR